MNKEGLIQKFDRKGRLLHETTYVDGKRQGVSRFRRHRRLMITAYYWKGILHGPYRVEKDGKLIIETVYVHGAKVGFERRYCLDHTEGVSVGPLIGKTQFVGNVISAFRFGRGTRDHINEGPEYIYTMKGDMLACRARYFGICKKDLQKGIYNEEEDEEEEDDISDIFDFFL